MFAAAMRIGRPYLFTATMVFGTIAIQLSFPALGIQRPYLLWFLSVFLVTWRTDKFLGFLVTFIATFIASSLVPEPMSLSSLIGSIIFLTESMIFVFALSACKRKMDDEKQKHKEVEDQFMDYRATCEYIPHLIWWCDTEGKTIHFNKQWIEYTGMKICTLSLNEVSDSGIFHPEDLLVLIPRLKVKNKDTRTQTQIYEIRIRNKHNDYRWHLGRANPRRGSDGTISQWIGTCTEIHEDKLAMERIGMTDKLKDEFLATLSHELRNPIAPITTAVANLNRSQSTLSEPARKMVDIIRRQTIQMARLVDDLLDISRINQGKIRLEFEPVEIAGVVHQAVESVQSQIENKCQHFKLDIADELIFVDGDRTRLTQILVNLLTNASKYTEVSGSIWLTVTKADKRAIISVQDSGIGISKEAQIHVFDLFMQEDRSLTRSQGGLGIGLNLVKRLTELHYGEVSVFSEGIGKGSTFTVSLPLSRDSVIIKKLNDTETKNDRDRKQEPGVV